VIVKRLRKLLGEYPDDFVVVVYVESEVEPYFTKKIKGVSYMRKGTRTVEIKIE